MGLENTVRTDEELCRELHAHLCEVVDYLDLSERCANIAPGLENPEVRALLIAHLDRCSECTHSYEVERLVRTLLRRSYKESAPASLRAKIVASTCVSVTQVSWQS